MLFNKRFDGYIECVDWCDLEDDDICIGYMSKSPEDGYYRFTVTSQSPLSCRHLKLAAKKLSELNKGVIKV
jgi:hypothetical protein